jgi:hypothetical protein
MGRWRGALPAVTEGFFNAPKGVPNVSNVPVVPQKPGLLLTPEYAPSSDPPGSPRRPPVRSPETHPKCTLTPGPTPPELRQIIDLRP